MKPKILLCLALGLSIPFNNSFASEPPTGNQPQRLVHNWEYITYPIVSLSDGKTQVGFNLRPEKSVYGLRLDILDMHGPGGSFWAAEVLRNVGAWTRLHRANGEIVAPLRSLQSRPSETNAGLEWAMENGIMLFPWGTNALEESWIEVSMGAQRYWLEVPYGFDRNPADPLPPATPGGCPQFAPAMKELSANDHIMRWVAVHYDLGEIENGWRLSLIQSNSVDAQCEVILYRNDFRYSTRTLWATNSPHTALRVLNVDGEVIQCHRISFLIHDDRMRRSDMFDINRNGDDLRSWGQIEISVYDKSYRVVVPSSLYKYTHGHASAN